MGNNNNNFSFGYNYQNYSERIYNVMMRHSLARLKTSILYEIKVWDKEALNDVDFIITIEENVG